MKVSFCEPRKGLVWRFVIPLMIVCFFGVLVILAIFNWRVTSKDYLADIIARDVSQLASILERIDEECTILSFDYQKNIINFLQIKSFVGSEVGSINLAHQDKWQGPYLDDNPTYQEKEYLVVRTDKGYFVTPGEGIKLPNGKVIGKDIILDENADIAAMMNDKQQLKFNDRPLAAILNISASVQAPYLALPIERI